MKNCSIDDFKAELDQYLEKLPDQPETDGLTPWGQDYEGNPSKSILHQVARETAKRGPGA